MLSTAQRDRSLSADLPRAIDRFHDTHCKVCTDLLGAVVFDGLIKACVRLVGCFAAEYKTVRRAKKLDDRV